MVEGSITVELVLLDEPTAAIRAHLASTEQVS